MKKEILQNVAVLAATVIFTTLFYKAGTGLNASLFALAIIGLLFWQDPERLQDKRLLIFAGATLLAAFAYLINHSVLAFVTYLMSLLVFVGFCHQRTLRFLGYAALLSFVSIFQMPVNAFRQLKFIECWWAGFPVIPFRSRRDTPSVRFHELRDARRTPAAYRSDPSPSPHQVVCASSRLLSPVGRRSPRYRPLSPDWWCRYLPAAWS